MRTVYINGAWLPESEAHISLYDLSVMQGAGAFTMCRSFKQKIFKLDEHLQRLEESCRVLGIPLALSRQALHAVCDEIVDRNRDVFDPADEHRLLIVASPGCAPMYRELEGVIAQPYVYVTDFPLKFTTAGLGRQFTEGGKAVVTTVIQVPDDCVPSVAKHRNRLHFHLAQEEAKRRGADWAILCTQDADVAECPGGNLCAVINGVLVAPSRNALQGISRATVLEIAESLSLPISRQHTLTLDDLELADEVFVTGTPFCALPLSVVDGDEKDCPGPVYRELLSAWSARVGVNIAEQIMGWDKSCLVL